MSPLRRARSASVASRCSRRFFSRMTCCERCGFDHRLGSAACFSISLSCGRILSASKILPKFADFFIQRCVFLLEDLIHEDDSALLPNFRIPEFFGPHEAREQRSCRNYRTQPGEPVAVACVERSYRSERVMRDQRSTLLAWKPLHSSPVGIYRRCHARVRRAQKPAVVLDGAHARLIQVLCVSAAVAVPAVV